MIRPAVPEDVTTVLRFVRELAEYERELDQVEATEEDLKRALFGPSPAVFAHIAEDEEGEPVGFALWFLNFSTWTGRHGIYLEDLYVTPEARGGGYGKALLAELARIAVERGYARYEWACLDWNEPSIRFYKSLGAEAMTAWTGYRLSGRALQAITR
ncbi:GNAT family N-acetyltransferase [Actinocorallia populi]|uniref:GNAT family N-acetyltransferase n=1 Tax=Actinocorallia populi TaxID=2079200 RepID=UPI000D096805|nr:GNAT family N-acetyltransferase [Actinocorallia populi]